MFIECVTITIRIPSRSDYDEKKITGASKLRNDKRNEAEKDLAILRCRAQHDQTKFG